MIDKTILDYMNSHNSKNDDMLHLEFYGDGSGQLNREGKCVFHFENLNELKDHISKGKTFNDELCELIEKYQTDDELHEWFTIRDSLLRQTDLIQLKITDRVNGG